MDAKRDGICFGVSEFYNEKFETCKNCHREFDCRKSIFEMPFINGVTLDSVPLDNKESLGETFETESKFDDFCKKIAPKLRKKEYDFRPIIKEVLNLKPTCRKEATAIIKRVGKVTSVSAPGYARMILWNLQTEGFLEGFNYEDLNGKAFWLKAPDRWSASL